MASLFVSGRFQLIGGELGTLETYAAGTTTPLVTYTTQAGDVPNPTTINLDANGRASVWLGSAAYRMIGKSALGVTIYDVDNITAAASLAALLDPDNALHYGPADIRRFGASASASAATNTAAIQAAIDSGRQVFTPNGEFAFVAPINLLDNTDLLFESRAAQWIANGATGPLLQGKNPTTERRFNIRIQGGKISNTTRTAAGAIGLDLKSVSMCKVFGTWFQEVETGIANGGTGSQGAFYNDFFGVDISGVKTGISNGSLGNDNHFFGGRVNDMEVGTRDNDCSGNSYHGVAIETFTVAGHLNSDTAAATNTKYVTSRIENQPGGIYASAVGIDIRALAQVCMYLFPQFTTVATDVIDLSATSDTMGWSDNGLVLKSGTPIKRHRHVVVNRDVASFAAGASRQEGPFTVPGVAVGDVVTCTLPGSWPQIMVGQCIVTVANTVYLPMHNPTGSAIDPAAGDFVFDVLGH